MVNSNTAALFSFILSDGEQNRGRRLIPEKIIFLSRWLIAETVQIFFFVFFLTQRSSIMFDPSYGFVDKPIFPFRF